MKKLSLFCAALFCTATMSAAINFDPQGGTLATAPADNAALWEEFKPAYKTYYKEDRGDQTIANVATFMTQGQKMLTDELSGWKWLGDILVKVTTDQGAALSSEPNWRFNTKAFFNAHQHTGWPKSADYTEAGKKSYWESGYIFANAPKNGERVFGGWYTDAACSEGNQVTNWTSVADGTTLYAKWIGETLIESIDWGTVAPVAAGGFDTIVPTVLPAGTTEAYTCVSSDSTVAIASITSQGVAIKGIKAGTATVTLSFTNGTSAKEITVTEAYAIELNEGTLSMPADNAELWAAFMPAYNEYYVAFWAAKDSTWKERGLQPMDKASTFAAAEMKAFMTDSASTWKWLGDYILIQAPAIKEVAETDIETVWRWTVHAFFNHVPSFWGQRGDWSGNGCLGVWRPYYVLAQTPVKEGYDFTGWYLDAACTEKAEAATLPATGTLYAGWAEKTATALENANANEIKVRKVVENGQLIILKDGVRYNALGAIVK